MEQRADFHKNNSLRFVACIGFYHLCVVILSSYSIFELPIKINLLRNTRIFHKLCNAKLEKLFFHSLED